MLKTIRGLILGLVVLVDSAYVTPTYASSASIVISRVQAGSIVSPLYEAIVIYNNSDERIDLSQWCFVNKANVRFACFGQVGIRGDRFIMPHTYVTAVSANLASTLPYERYTIPYDVTHSGSGSIIASSDIISLVDSQGDVVDQHLWTTPLQNGNMWQRQFISPGSNVYADTDKMSDWKVAPQEQTPIDQSYFISYPSDIDTCSNIEGRQIGVPKGYRYEQEFMCYALPPISVDSIAGYEQVDPAGEDDAGDDGIPNPYPVIDPPEPETPETTEPPDSPEPPAQPVLHPMLSEIMPNAEGADAGKEFIEIYNPHGETIHLAQYSLLYGKDLEIGIAFPFESIAAGEYMTFTNSDADFTLLNTENRVAIFYGDIIVDETRYPEPKEDWSWARMAAGWEYTNVLTPGSTNVSQVTVSSSKSVVATAAVKVATAPKPCAPNQERNPETNRCRLIASSEEVEPAACKEGQERNPETNRCRNIKQMSTVDYAVIGARTEDQSSSTWYVWASIAGVLGLALAYAIWEWRVEIRKGVMALRGKFVRATK